MNNINSIDSSTRKNEFDISDNLTKSKKNYLNVINTENSIVGLNKSTPNIIREIFLKLDTDSYENLYKALIGCGHKPDVPSLEELRERLKSDDTKFNPRDVFSKKFHSEFLVAPDNHTSAIVDCIKNRLDYISDKQYFRAPCLFKEENILVLYASPDEFSCDSRLMKLFIHIKKHIDSVIIDFEKNQRNGNEPVRIVEAIAFPKTLFVNRDEALKNLRNILQGFDSCLKVEEGNGRYFVVLLAMRFLENVKKENIPHLTSVDIKKIENEFKDLISLGKALIEFFPNAPLSEDMFTLRRKIIKEQGPVETCSLS